MLLVLMGKTCAGKNAVVDSLKGEGYKQIITYTSRPRRRGEKNGREYHFISDEDFANKIDTGFFAEWKSYNVNGKTWYYGSPTADIAEAITSKEKYVLILTPKGVSDIKHLINKSNSLIIYLYANRHTILNRLKKRRDNNDTIVRRMNADERDFKDALNICDKIVYNNDEDSLQDAVAKIIKIADKM